MAAKIPAAAMPRIALFRGTYDASRRTVIRNVRLAVARAPIVVVRLTRLVERRITLVAIAEASSAGGLAAAVVIGDHVILAVARIVASSNPRHRRHIRAGRTAGRTAAAASAQETVDRAVAPVIASGGIRMRTIRRGLGFLSTGHRQQRNRCRPCD